jgi:hypothetical protein
MADTQYFPNDGALYLFLFTNVWFICSVTIAWTAFWVFLSIRQRDWHWFARCGAIIAFAGGMLTCRTVLRRTAEYHRGILQMTIFQTLSAEELTELERDALASKIGLGFLVGGSLVWAYGDLVGRLVPRRKT